MAVRLAASAIRTCLGDGEETFAALLAGRSGAGPLRHPAATGLNVTRGFHREDPPIGSTLRASQWVTECVRDAVRLAGVDPGRERVAVLAGTGLRELGAVEQWALGDDVPAVESLHLRGAVAAGACGLPATITLSGACSAGGHALGLAQDMIELGDADAVVVVAADSMTVSMLAMIGRVAEVPSQALRPFDAGRSGVLLGEGAAAAVLVPATRPGVSGPSVLATGLSCDAHHETAPSVDGIARAMDDAFARAGRSPDEVGLVLAHGTGTALNDPAEIAALRSVLGGHADDVLITANKGAVGHTSGAAAMVNLDVAARVIATGHVPGIAGLEQVLPEGASMRFARTGGASPQRFGGGLIMLDAFGFGGVNAITLLEAS